MSYGKRVNKLQVNLLEQKIDYLLVTNPSNILYLTGFRGLSPTEREVTALIDKSGLTLFSPRLYSQEVKKLSEKYGFNVFEVDERHHLFSEPAKLIKKGETVGIEENDLRLSELNELKIYPISDIKYTKNIVETLRLEKDIEELQIVKEAVKITDITFRHIKKFIKPGITEKQLAKKITDYMESIGSDGVAFDPIVAFGKNSSFPHYVTGNSILNHGIVLIDAGARYKGFNGDLTRTYWVGKMNERFVKTYNLVLKTQKKAIDGVRSGIKGEDAWKISFESFGTESKYFTHGLGHGIGLDIHESPFLRRNNKEKLVTNSLVTIEPGLYYPKWGGIRIEDYCLITRSGCEVLSSTPKELNDSIIV